MNPPQENTAISAPGARRQDSQAAQEETAALFAELVRRYTAGYGSSVKDETASQLLRAITFAAKAGAAAAGFAGDLPGAIRDRGVRALYQRGIDAIRACFDETKRLFQDADAHRLNVPLAPYHDLLDHAVPSFLSSYDIEFDPLDTKCDISYPLALDLSAAQGVFYMRHYLDTLRMETDLCGRLDHGETLRTLAAFGAQFELDVTDAPINLFEILFDQLVFAVLAGQTAPHLSVTPAQLGRLEALLSHADGEKAARAVNGAVGAAADMLHVKDPALLSYMRRYSRQLSGRIAAASENGSLVHLVLVKGQNPLAARETFADGEPMDDEAFTLLAERVTACEQTGEKIELVKSEVHSMRDFTDLLGADCFWGEEYAALFASLDDAELAVLTRRVFADEAHLSRLRLSPSLLEHRRRSPRADWEPYLLDVLSGMDEARLRRIETRADRLSLRDE